MKYEVIDLLWGSTLYHNERSISVSCDFLDILRNKFNNACAAALLDTRHSRHHCTTSLKAEISITICPMPTRSMPTLGKGDPNMQVPISGATSGGQSSLSSTKPSGGSSPQGDGSIVPNKNTESIEVAIDCRPLVNVFATSGGQSSQPSTKSALWLRVMAAPPPTRILLTKPAVLIRKVLLPFLHLPMLCQ